MSLRRFQIDHTKETYKIPFHKLPNRHWFQHNQTGDLYIKISAEKVTNISTGKYYRHDYETLVIPVIPIKVVVSKGIDK